MKKRKKKKRKVRQRAWDRKEQITMNKWKRKINETDAEKSLIFVKPKKRWQLTEKPNASHNLDRRKTAVKQKKWKTKKKLQQNLKLRDWELLKGDTMNHEKKLKLGSKIKADNHF